MIFLRKHRAKARRHNYSRKSLIEQLEIRQLLTSEAAHVLIPLPQTVHSCDRTHSVLLDATTPLMTRIAEGELGGGTEATRLNVSTVDAEAEEDNAFYCDGSANVGSFKVTLTEGTWTGGSITVGLSGSATPNYDYDFSTGQIAGSDFTFFLPAISSVGQGFIVTLNPAADGVEPGFKDALGAIESASESVVISGPSIYVSGTANINIADQVENPSLEVPYASAHEMPSSLLPSNIMSVSDGTFGQFELTPESGKTICSVFYWEIDTSASNSAILGTDYSLVDEDPSSLTFSQPYPVQFPWLWRSNARTATNPAKAKLRVVAFEDGVLEETEIVKVRAIAVPNANMSNPTPSVPSEEFQIRTSWQTVSIVNDYQDGNVQLDSQSTCSCECHACVDGNGVSADLNSGAANVQLVGGLINAVSPSQEGLFPVIQVGVKLPIGKAVPSSLQVKLNVVEPDMDANNNPRGLGRKLVATNSQVSPTITFAMPSAAAPGYTVWFSLQADLTAHAQAWSGSTVQEKLLPLELLVASNFTAGTNVNSTYSGFVGRKTVMLRDERASNISPTLGGNLTLGGVDRLIRNAMMMVPDTASNQPSFGKVTYQYGTMLVRAGGGYSWFANNAGSTSDTQDILASDVVTDGSGNKKRFNLIGQMTEFETAAGDKSLYAYMANGAIQSITDPRGQLTTFTYSNQVGGTGKNVDIKTINNAGNDILVRLKWTPITVAGGNLTIDYDDPDGAGPRIARRDVLEYNKLGFFTFLYSGEVGNLNRITRFNYDIAYDASNNPISGTRRIFSIVYPDVSTSRTFNFTGRNHSVVSPWSSTVAIASTGRYAARAGGDANAIPNYAIVTDRRGGATAQQTSFYQLDQRGRVLRYWDPVQVEAMGLTSGYFSQAEGMTSFAINTLNSNSYRSWEYTRQPTQRNGVGEVVGSDLGEVLSVASPQVASGQQTFSYSYLNNNPVAKQTPLQGQETFTWNDTYDIPTMYIDQNGNRLQQTVDSRGRVTSQTWSQGNAAWQNPTWDVDVNNDGILSPSDALLLINLLNAGGGGPVPPSTPTNFYDVSGDDYISPVDSLLVVNALNSGQTQPPIKPKVDRVYNETVGLPYSLMTQSTVKTGRADGDSVSNFIYYNTPTNMATHSRLYQIVQPTAGGNAITTLQYDNRGNVIQVTDPAGRNTRFWYDKLDRLIGKLSPDPDGTSPLLPALERWDYDVFDNVIATEVVNSYLDAGKLVVTALKTGYKYDAINRLTEINSQNPNVVWYLNNGINGIVEGMTAPTTTSNITEPNLWAYAFNNTRISNVPSTAVATQLGWRQVITYFSTPNQITVAESNSTSAARTTTYTVDRLNRITQVLTPPTGGGVINSAGAAVTTGLTSSYTYDALGNVTSYTDPLGNLTSTAYDGLNRPLTVTRPGPTTMPPSSPVVTSFSYLEVARKGLKTTATDPLGNSVSVQQDMFGRPIAVTGQTPNYSMEYWADGAVKRSTDANAQSTIFDFDRRGLMTSTTTAVPSAGQSSSVTSYQYGIDGQLLKIVDPMLRETSMSYDAGGRVTRVIQPDPDGAGPLVASFQDSTLDSLGNTMATTDALGQTTRFTRDAWRRVLTSIDPASAVTTFSYDVFGNMTSVTDPLANQTTFTFNNLDWLLTENKVGTGGGGARTYSYDSVGNVRRLVDRNARTTTWNYDNLFRPISEVWTTGATTNRTLSYTYDAASRLTGVTDSDVLSPDFVFAYNARNELRGEQQTHKFMSNSRVLLNRLYDSNGNQTSLAANFGGTLTGATITGGVWDFSNSLNYDAMNRLSSVTQSSANGGGNAVAAKTATIQYNAASQLTDIRRYAATSADAANLKVHTRQTYDNAGRLISITHGKTAIAVGESWNGTSTAPTSLGTANLLAAYKLTYDADNRVTNLGSWRDAFSTAYTYSATDQLTAATSTQIAGLTLPNPLPTAESYNLDANGNRRTSAGSSQSATGTHNRLQSDGTFSYTYDGEGNVTRRTRLVGGQVTDYTWDHRNRLTSVIEKTSAVGTITKKTEYIYDAFDQRVGKRLDTGTIGSWDRYEAFVWADGQEAMRLVDSDGQTAAQPFRVANRYLWGAAVDQLLADEQYALGTGPAVNSPTASTTSGNTLWALSDHLGSVRDLVDNSGVIRQHVVFDSFGRRVREVDYNSSGAVIANNDPAAIDELFGYTGRDWDVDTQLQNNRARWYDPATGRWLTQDPIGFSGGDANLYRYVGNSATGATDPSGRYGVDFHFYVIYSLFRARGWDHHTSYIAAGWSQYMDDDPATSPWNGVVHAATTQNFANPELLKRTHFWGCKDGVDVSRNPEDLRALVESAIKDYLTTKDESLLGPLAGVLLHTFADTWAHEGFTAWWTSKNAREGSLRPNIGHGDTAEGGHFPDNPYNDLNKALEAAKTIYGLIPRGSGKHVPWHILEPELRAAFDSPISRGRDYNYEKTTSEQVAAMKQMISKIFKTDCQYNMEYFARNRDKFMTIYSMWVYNQ